MFRMMLSGKYVCLRMRAVFLCEIATTNRRRLHPRLSLGCRTALLFRDQRRREIDSGAACVAGWRMKESGLDSKQTPSDYRYVVKGGRIVRVNHPCSEQGVVAAIGRRAGRARSAPCHHAVTGID
jgi:hypothetical protein